LTSPGFHHRAVWIFNARTIEIQHGANEPQSRAGRWQARLICQERGDTANEHPSIESAENKSLGGIAPQPIDLLPEN